MANIFPEFKGKPLIEIPAFIPSAGFLEGDFGKAVLKEYQERAKADYDNVSALNILSYNSGVVTGSNSFAVVLVNKIISQDGLRTATHADLEKVIKTNALPLRGQYEDTALVLRDENNPNKYLTKNLMAQIKAKNPNVKMPAMFPLSELELVADANSPYKLSFNLKDSAQAFYDLSVLNKNGNFSSEDIDEKTGLPNKTSDKGNRCLYTRNSGLSRFYLNRNLFADSDNENLAYSDGGGRVVVMSAEGASQNFQNYFTQLQQEAESQKAEIDARFAKAKAIMLGKQ